MKHIDKQIDKQIEIEKQIEIDNATRLSTVREMLHMSMPEPL